MKIIIMHYVISRACNWDAATQSSSSNYMQHLKAQKGMPRRALSTSKNCTFNETRTWHLHFITVACSYKLIANADWTSIMQPLHTETHTPYVHQFENYYWKIIYSFLYCMLACFMACTNNLACNGSRSHLVQQNSLEKWMDFVLYKKKMSQSSGTRV